MEKNFKNTFSNWKTILLLQILVFIYSLTGTISKFAAICMGKYGIISFQVLGAVILMIFILGIYAVFWQRILKRTDLSVAYANKGVGLLWTLVWSVALFEERITFNNIVGILIICIGVIVVTDNG